MSGPRKTCCCDLGAECPSARHHCEPTYYPSGAGDEWTCPECERIHVSFRVDTDPRTAEIVKKHLNGETWGWHSAALS
jgi:hypothetical protein